MNATDQRLSSLAPLMPAAQALAALASIPEERLWLESYRSPSTRAAYRNDVAGFMAFLGISTPDELRLVDRAAVVAFQRCLDDQGVKPTTINRKLAALSSLFSHLVRHQVVSANPCRDIRRASLGRQKGVTPAFSKEQARLLLDAPDLGTLQGLRDRAILSVGLQAGPRRAAITALKVRDFYMDAGEECLRFKWKGGHEHALALNPETAERIRAYLEASGHAGDLDGPLFRPMLSIRPGSLRRHLRPWTINFLLRRYLKKAGIPGRFSPHSMRATFITTTLANGAPLDVVQRDAGHASPTTTRLYDRRQPNPAQSAAFFARY